MAKEFSEKFYHSKAWKKCRESYISQRITLDGGMCERCHERLGYILHHKTELNPTNILDPNITLNHCNLEWLCKPCHDEEHYVDMHGTEKKTSRCLFGPDGQPIPRSSDEE